MRSLGSSLFLFLSLVLTLVVSPTDAQPEFVKPVNYTYDDPVVFNQWCDDLTEMYGPTCTCETTYGISNNIDSVDLDHEINCDPLQGKSTCISNVTVDSARIWLKATSIGEVGNYETIKETAITDFYVFLDDTSIDTISFRFNDGIGQRRTGCLAVFGAVNCARCGVCDAPPNDKEAEYPVHLGPKEIFNGISGVCNYGNGPPIGLFNTCTNGSNILTDIAWYDLEITAADQIGPCADGTEFRPAPEEIETQEEVEEIEAEEKTTAAASSGTSIATVAAMAVSVVSAMAYWA
ncbi:expressed unknown protein [Seminavis robusta]|uniref:Uncharacterized protein n=1 Tax=Seminavis robusta TaxID=568900 RepID=A0A9N8HL74_9STRA|nr:expressed unknown protein [Seminavis robusta]|eukprot:Sro663_g183580.1 n/a (292) ;mRNA; r:45403-46278